MYLLKLEIKKTKDVGSNKIMEVHANSEENPD